MNWYAVNTKPRQEELGERSLQRLGIETFSPQFKQTKIIRRKLQMVIRPLFAGYLFARFELESHYRAVNYALGVRKLVSFGSVPAIVDDEIVEAIQSKIHDGHITGQPSPFRPGQAVHIQGGKLQGFEAVFEREISDQQRVVLLLQALSYQVRVIVDLDQVVNL
jgi:transcriptional antiterminator RfaH